MLTLYYVSATFLQSWRISKVCQKITEQLASQASIAFYALPSLSDDGFDAAMATSELCSNREVAKVSEILWLHGNYRGCCVMPLQTIQITPWISFPNAPSLQPFAFNESSESLLRSLDNGRNDLIRLLIETAIQPSNDDYQQQGIVRIENYGKLVAWKIDSHLAVLIETNTEYFTKLLIDTFLQNNFLLNDHLPLLRIESVKNDGVPQPYSELSSHLRKPIRSNEIQGPEEWSKHLQDLKSLSVLAHQATEYSYNKNKTEVKADTINTDSIPQKKSKQREESRQQMESLTQSQVDGKASEVVQPPAKDLPLKLSPEKSKMSKDTGIFIKTEQLATAVQAIPTTVTAKSSSSTTSEAANVLSSSTKTYQSPSKSKLKPTEIKKPVVIDTGRFKAAKISDKTTATSVETIQTLSESEKIVAAKPEFNLIQSPTPKASDKSENISSTATENETIASSSKEPEKTKPNAEQKDNIISSITPAAPMKTLSELAKVVAAKTEFNLKQSSTPKASDKSENISSTATENETTASCSKVPEKTKPIAEQKDNIISTLPPAAPTEASLVQEKSTFKTSTTTTTASTSSDALIGSKVTSVVKDNAKRPSLKRHKDSLTECKPLNVLVYAETATARESAENTLKEILADNTYTIYPLTEQQAEQKHWINTTALLVVCGTVPHTIGELFVDYFLRGGKVLSLCSDVLHFILPTYRTAEVREHELVQFSYDKWQKVKMMHHIFCYQPSPVKKNFSTDSDDSVQPNNRRSALVCPPRSIELKDLKGDMHHLDVKVLGTEETWNTPSLLLANNKKSGGTAVFSQVHLEINPNEFESDESKFSVLKQNDNIRHEIFADLLKNHLNLSVHSDRSNATGSGPKVVYKNAYILGRYEAKFELLEKLKPNMDTDHMIMTPNLRMKFYGAGDKLPQVNSNILPILIHSCPEDFSTVDYFENLKTAYIGRLVLYAPILNSSQHIVTNLDLTNGIAVIPRQQTNGVGRSNNQWISPLGCAMFSIQLHMKYNSPLSHRSPLIQHIVGAAVVNSLKNHSLYKVLDIGLKWPNDAYANGINKIGGLVVNTSLLAHKATVNIGCAINLDNNKPTICLNDMIRDYNNANQKNLPLIKYEILLALIFNEIERLIELVQTGEFESFYRLYYELWLHSNQSITICDKDGSSQEAEVIGIDDYGYLKVKLTNGSIEVVQPDGNSFDMLKGLIIPKFN